MLYFGSASVLRSQELGNVKNANSARRRLIKPDLARRLSSQKSVAYREQKILGGLAETKYQVRRTSKVAAFLFERDRE